MVLNKLNEQRERDIALLHTYPAKRRFEVGSRLYKTLSNPQSTERLARVARDFSLDYSEYHAGWEDFCKSLRFVGKDRTYQFFKTLLGKRKNETENFFPYSTELSEFLTRLTFINWYEPQTDSNNERVELNINTHLKRLRHPKTNLKIITILDDLDKFYRDVWNEFPYEEQKRRIEETAGHPYYDDQRYHTKTQKYYYDRTHSEMDFVGKFLDIVVNMALGCTQNSKLWKNKESRIVKSWNPYFSHPILTEIKTNTHYFDSITYGDCYACANYLIAENEPKFKRDWPEDPFLPLIDIYEAGLVPIGVFNQEYVLFRPQ